MGVDEFGVSDWCDLQGSVGGDHEASGDEVAVSGVDDGVEHGFEEEGVAHPFGYDDVDFRDGEFDFFDLAAEASGCSG